MSNREIILSEASREMMPDTIRASDYYAGNQQCIQDEYAVKQEILEYSKEFEPWQVEVARLHSRGQTNTAIGKALGKSRNKVAQALEDPTLKKLINFFIHLQILIDGPNEHLRKQMLWRIAVDNEKEDPKEATKAISELNRMADGKKGGGGGFNIVINGVELKKGPLDA